jgi:hypothetical protein
LEREGLHTKVGNGAPPAPGLVNHSSLNHL